MPDFSPVITQAYVRILGRPPDAGGPESYNQAMNFGLTEERMRESLLRSNEYAIKNPDTLRATSTSSKKRKKATKKKPSKKKSRKRQSSMPSFRPIIRHAYVEILRREPDAGGLEHYNRLMNQGMSEADMREGLLRSDEYARKNPLVPLAPLAPRVGLNVHIPTNAMLNDVALNLGVRWIRVDFDWYRIEPSQGIFRWQDTDRVIDHATSLGLDILATLSYTPAWASSNPSNPRLGDPPASVTYWTDIVRATAERYRDRVAFWQPWNEPNIEEFWNGSMARYRTGILQPGASLMRQLAPSASVVAPGLANVGS